MNSATENKETVWIDSDLGFIQSLSDRNGGYFKKCFQCGTCSSTCSLAPDAEPFPRKEMAWANWGMKDNLLTDSDVWLCYHCNDCSTGCPRGARPGDLLASIRQETVINYSFPRFFGRWANDPKCIPLLLGIPALFLTIALYVKSPIEKALNLAPIGDKIVYPYTSMFPHWLLNSFFLFFSLLSLIVIIFGAVKFWKALKNSAVTNGNFRHANDIFPSVLAVGKKIFLHDDFTSCKTEYSRYWSHICLFFGFIGLCLVTFWIITSGINPFLRGEFLYPFGFWNPWKLLANIGGLAIFAGCILIIYNRFRESDEDNDNVGVGVYFDWFLVAALSIVVLTGFITEFLHYLRLEPHRHIAYFVHLVFAFTLLIYLPYTKFAHIVYRTIALIFAEHIGRKRETSQTVNEKERIIIREEVKKV